MRGARKVTYALSFLVVGCVLAIGATQLQEARERARGTQSTQRVRTFASPLARQTIPGSHEANPDLAVTYGSAMASIQAERRQALEDGVNYNPHVHTSDGRYLMLQDDHMVSIMQGTLESPMAQSSPIMAQEGEAGSAWCVEGDHLPEEAPEGSMTGCECGAKCDPDTGKPIGRESANCKRHCHRDDCMCGNCI